MANGSKEWKGITINEGIYQGKIIEDPVIVPAANGNRCAFLKLRTFINELAPNGQWTESPSIIPLVVLDQRKVDVVEKYVKAERELYVRAYYKSWDVGDGHHSHGMIVTQMKLGSKGFKKDLESTPPLPA